MSDTNRRLILLPPGVTGEERARLQDALREVVAAQNRLTAASPYVLQLAGELRSDPRGFSIAHEPATTLNPATLFAPDAPLGSEDQCLQLLAALSEALAAGHSAGGGRPLVHGGICPATVLLAEDGLYRVTDFGVAPAICKILGVDSYVNLAVAAQPDCSAAWQVLPENVVDRDDRLCAFIDPDKYGQDTLGSFEPGSDIIAAGFVLRLMAEHRHPYLFFEAEAHRVVDMARMMGFGVPSPLARPEWETPPSPALKVWCDLVMAMLSRLPRERPAASEVVRRLREVVPPPDLDALKARRWMTRLAALVQAKAFRTLPAALEERPVLKTWPPDLTRQASELEAQARKFLAEEGEKAAVAADHQAAQEWAVAVTAATERRDWETAHRLLHDRPALQHWPSSVDKTLEPVRARIADAWDERRARLWHAALQAAVEAEEWIQVGKRLAHRPPVQKWPPEILSFVSGVEREYAAKRVEIEREQKRIAAEQAAAQAWFGEAKALTTRGQWDAALDRLSAPPDVQHWPAGLRVEVAQLEQSCRSHLGTSIEDSLRAIDDNVAALAQAIVRDVLAEKFEHLLRPAQVKVTTDLVIWNPPDVQADARGRINVIFRPTGAPGEDEPIRGELDFNLADSVVALVNGQQDFARLVGEELAGRLRKLQTARLLEFQATLRAGLFPTATVVAKLNRPHAEITADVAWLGENGGAAPAKHALKWNDGDLAWRPADPATFAAEARELVLAGAQRTVLGDLAKRSADLRAIEKSLALELTAPATTATFPSKPLVLEARLLLGEAGAARPLWTGRVTCESAARARIDSDVREIEAHLEQLILAAQDQSREDVTAQLQSVAKAAPSRPKLTAPKRTKLVVEKLAFELRPKSGEPVALTATWNTATLAYELPAGWEKVVAEKLGAAPALVEPVRAKAPAREAEVAPTAPTARPRGLIYGAAAAGVVLVAVGAYFLFGRGGTPPARPQPAPAAAENQPTPPAHGPEAVTEKPTEKPVVPPTEVAGASPQPPVTERPKPEEPVAPEPVVTEAKGEDGVAAVRGLLQAQAGLSDAGSAALDKLVPILLGAAHRNDPAAGLLVALAEPQAAVGAVQAGGADRVTLEVTVTQKVAAEPQAVSLAFQRAGQRWEAAATNAQELANLATGLKSAALEAVTRVQSQARASRGRGDLPGVYEALAPVRGVLVALANEREVANVRAWLATLPPPWTERQEALTAAGYAADGPVDVASGYPERLKDGQGRALLLVSCPPSDELWTQLRLMVKPDGPLGKDLLAPLEERPWRLYYIDNAELAAQDEFAGAQGAAREAGRVVPTRSQWMLAALKLRTRAPADLFGGLREWCSDDGGSSADNAWVCGGISRTLSGREQIVPPLPDNPANVGDLWTWLNNPLVIQRRNGRFGDHLTAVRTILPISPG